MAPLASKAWERNPLAEDLRVFTDENTLRFKDYADLALYEYLSKWANNGSFRPISQEHIDIKPHSKRKIYNEIVKGAYDKKASKTWEDKLRNFHGRSLAYNVHDFFENWNSVHTRAPAHVKTRFLTLILNATSTSLRTSWWKAKGKERTVGNFPCPFCGEGRDDVRHFTKDCSPIWKEFHSIAGNLGAWDDNDLWKEEDPGQVMTLNSNFKNCPDPTHTRRVVLGLVSTIPLLRDRVLAKGSNSNLNEEYTNLLEGALKETTGSKERKKMAGKGVLKKLENLPEGTIVAYTDGSSLGNPGPAGAGAYILHPEEGVYNLYAPLGNNTNNVGELWAIAMVINIAKRNDWVRS